jgi:glyoxylase-like metal-dependent hydrolase (beta-lactamase superfamily II)
MIMIMKQFIFTLTVLLIMSRSGATLAQETVLTFQTGDCRVSVLSEGGRDAESSLLSGATPEILAKCLPTGKFLLEIQAFLIRFDDRNVLIDAGVGKNLSANIQSLGLSGDQIHTVLLTHMHGDHIGGLLIDGEKAFPNADLYVAQAEYDYWTDAATERGEGARKALNAYRDRLHLFVPADVDNGEQADLIPSVKAIAAPGHTPGHTAFLLESAGQKLLFWGDVTHATEVQTPHPEVTLSFDHDSKQAAQTRRKIFDYVLENGIGVAGAHIKIPAIGNIKKGDGGAYGFVPLCTCEAI